MRKFLITFTYILFIFVFVAAAQDQPKALTNADVSDMVKAGLPENTIIMTIERSPAKYDTSAQSLIQLNKDGVSAKVLDAMLKANSPAPAAGPTVTNQVSAGSFQETTSAMSISGGVVYVDGSDRKAMKRMTPKTKTDTGKMMIPYVGLFMKAKSYSVFNGNHSDLRIANSSPEFEVGIAADLKASDAIGIVRLDVDKETRKVQMLEFGVLGGTSGSRKKDIMPITLKEVPNGSGQNAAIATYRISTSGPLTPGEYAVVVNGVLFYDFGVDIMR